MKTLDLYKLAVEKGLIDDSKPQVITRESLIKLLNIKEG